MSINYIADKLTLDSVYAKLNELTTKQEDTDILNEMLEYTNIPPKVIGGVNCHI